jgi:hypothetical protein
MLISDYEFVKKILLDIISKEQYNLEIPSSEIEIISGNANRGADWLGEKFAREYSLSLRLFPVNWNDMNPPVIIGTNAYGTYNKLGGNNRNQKMADYMLSSGGGITIAFNAEQSKKTTGTKNMIRISKAIGFKVYHIKCQDKQNYKIKIYNGEKNE